MRFAHICAVLVVACTLPAQQLPQHDEDLLAAARKGDLARVRALVEGGANIEAKTRYETTPLFFAAKNGHLDVVEFLISKGANVNVTDSFYKMSALSVSLDKGGLPMIRALLKAGATGGGDLLQGAVFSDNREILPFLLEATNPNPAQLTQALQAAARRKDEQAIALLRKAGAKDLSETAVQLAPEILARYEGTYRSDRAGEMKVSLKEGKLRGNLGGQEFELIASDEFSFSASVNAMAKFKFSVVQGKTTNMTLQQGAQNLIFERVEAGK